MPLVRPVMVTEVALGSTETCCSAFCGSGVMRVSVHAIDICRTGGTLVGMRW